MRSPKFRRGFGLTEALIASVLLGILALVVSKMIAQSLKGQNTATANTALEEYLALTSLLLKNSDACVSSLGVIGASAGGLAYSASAGAPNITLYEPKLKSTGGYDPGTQVLAAQNFEVPRASGKIGDVTLSAAKTRNSLGGGSHEYLSSLQFAFNQAAGSTVGAQQKLRDLPVMITTDAGGKITGCHTVVAGLSSLANQGCDEGQVVTGFDAAGLVDCRASADLMGGEAGGLLGPTDPLPSGANVMSCTILGCPHCGGGAAPWTRTYSCDSIKTSCSFTNGKWQIVNTQTTSTQTRICTGGVAIDYPPEGTVVKTGTEFYSVDPAVISASQCVPSTQDQTTCKTILPTAQAAPPVAATSPSTIVSASGVSTTKTVSGIQFGGVFYATSATNTVCAFVTGQWKIYRGPSGTNCDSMTFLPK